jgi:phosphatidylglycerophosphate synthase
MIDFCEQTDPGVLRDLRLQNPNPQNTQRVHHSLVAAPEKRALIWMAERAPRWLTPDHLTALGLAAQIGAGVGYALARYHCSALLGVIACLAVNWLGDSLDGTLARVRRQQRPLYGFYVDHMVDSFGSAALMGGLALSGYMHPYVAIGLLVAFLLLSIQSYLAAHTLGEFHISFWKFGPTELRILLAMGNLALFHWPVVLPGRYRLFDLGGVVGLAGMTLMLLYFSAQNTHRLYQRERIV